MEWERGTYKTKAGDEYQNACSIQSVPSGFTICRSPQNGFVAPGGTVTYTLTKGNTIVAVERGVINNGEAIGVALAMLKRKAEELQEI
jgi:hypothetical protein